jgi:hypothetical protein
VSETMFSPSPPRSTARPFGDAVAVADRRHRSIAKNKRLDEALVVRRAPLAARILLSGGRLERDVHPKHGTMKRERSGPKRIER